MAQIHHLPPWPRLPTSSDQQSLWHHKSTTCHHGHRCPPLPINKVFGITNIKSHIPKSSFRKDSCKKAVDLKTMAAHVTRFLHQLTNAYRFKLFLLFYYFFSQHQTPTKFYRRTFNDVRLITQTPQPPS
ncbi:hypothetical protein L1887_22988 [Cichorium endivia]|nr:hypothetical protein L1887_22988 [Cichorium endivia]